MSYNVKTIPNFEKQAKKLAKKYVSFKNDLAELIESLSIDPKQGILIANDCYKIRLAIKSKNKGKSGGARVITHVMISNEDVYLLSVFDKSDKDNITDAELQDYLEQIER